MKTLILILLFFVGLSAKAQETYTISGTVSDEKGETLPGATVFLANTQKATATDASGKFILTNLQPGVYELVAKMLGYTVYNQSVIIQKASPILHIKLKENSIMLSTVKISAITTAERKKYMALFVQYFIGESEFAGKCKIMNPEVIDFNYDNAHDILEANSEKFIIIENKALGYNVHYLLKAFNMDVPRHVLFYDGSSYLEELTGTPAQQEKWEKNRQLTYLGSKWHFFKAAYDDKLKEEGFLIYKIPNRAALQKMTARNPNMRMIDQKFLLPFDNSAYLFTKMDENIKLFNLASLKRDSMVLYIVYTKKDEPYEYTYAGRSSLTPFKETPTQLLSGPKQVSSIVPLLDSMLVDKNGNANPASSVAHGGYWTWNMAAGFLPPDYKIPVKAQAKK